MKSPRIYPAFNLTSNHTDSQNSQVNLNERFQANMIESPQYPIQDCIQDEILLNKNQLTHCTTSSPLETKRMKSKKKMINIAQSNLKDKDLEKKIEPKKPLGFIAKMRQMNILKRFAHKVKYLSCIRGYADLQKSHFQYLNDISYVSNEEKGKKYS